MTNCRAKNTSMSSRNTIVTMDNPLRFSERMSVRPGSPVMAISSGTVMNRSTSSGDRPVASVAICTCTLVTSGKASSESFCIARRPKADSAMATTTRITRCCRQKRTILSIKSDVVRYAVQLSLPNNKREP